MSTLPRPTSPFTIPVGVFITGEVRVLLVSVLVLLIVGTVTPSTAITPPDTRDIVVSEALPSSIFPVVVIVPSVGLSPE